MAREDIGGREEVTGNMDHSKIKICEVKEPVSLAAV